MGVRDDLLPVMVRDFSVLEAWRCAYHSCMLIRQLGLDKNPGICEEGTSVRIARRAWLCPEGLRSCNSMESRVKLLVPAKCAGDAERLAEAWRT